MSVNTSRQDEFQKETVKSDVLKHLLHYMTGYKKQIALVLLVMFVTVAIAAVNPLLIEHAINVEIAGKDYWGLGKIVLLALVLNIILVAGIKYRLILMARIANHVLLEIRDELYEHIQTLSFSFFDSRPTGKILARVIGDVNSLKEVFSDSVTKLIPDLLTIVAVLGIMLARNWRLAMSAVLVLPLLAGGLYVIQIFSHRRWQVVRKKTSNLTGYIFEDYSGIQVVQSFGAETESEEEFTGMLKEQRNAFRNAILVDNGYSTVLEITGGLGSFLLYFIGIHLMGVGTVEVGTFVAFATYLTMFWNPLQNLSEFYSKLVTNISAAERIFDILDTKPEVKDREGAQELPDIEGAVRFDQVSFAYSDEPERKVLKEVSFAVNPGETVALVGPTGAGKTTIVNLISRFYNITSGHIYVDDYDLEQVTIQSLRRQMGVMTQDNYLFSGTIRDNIRYGRLDATEEEIIAAAKAVHAHEFIMQMEKGYDSEISERGVRLSIGQRQLIAFARTFVSNPRILILDEATSSIDTHTEILVQQGIESLLADRTSFVIAHRLSTIRHADRIFVIDDGKIQEAGNHEELMAKKGAYYDLYQAQFC
ncbi:MAG: ABC transporter ATP-binding protein [Lachnospiraceae bacterium]|nr:ABC transporter ATP-binding protein [Lachnospiraceae bacterium]